MLLYRGVTALRARGLVFYVTPYLRSPIPPSVTVHTSKQEHTSHLRHSGIFVFLLRFLSSSGEVEALAFSSPLAPTRAPLELGLVMHSGADKFRFHRLQFRA